MAVQSGFAQKLYDFFKSSGVMTCSLKDAGSYGERDAEKSIALVKLFSERVQQSTCVMA